MAEHIPNDEHENDDVVPEVNHDDRDDDEDGGQDAPFTPSAPEVEFDKSEGSIRSEEAKKPVDEDAIKNGIFIPLLRESLQTFREVVSHRGDDLEQRLLEEERYLENFASSNTRFPEDNEGDHWARNFIGANANQHTGGIPAFRRKGSVWSNNLQHEGKNQNIGTTRPQRKDLRGEAFLEYMRHDSGLGERVNVPLYNSGVWLRFRTPSSIALATFRDRVAAEKVSVGRWSKGMAFSTTNNSLTSLAVDFALEHVIDSNVSASSPTDYKEVILQTDIPVLIWGFACAIWPDGFDFTFPCIASKDCNHVEKKKIALPRLLWHDSKAITQKQRAHLARRFVKVSLDDLEAYRADSPLTRGRRVMIMPNIGLDLIVPTIADYEAYSAEWMDLVSDWGDRVMGEEGTARENRLTEIALRTSACWYGHWVGNLCIAADPDGDSDEFYVEDDPETVQTALVEIFSEQKYSTKFLEAVTAFIDDTRVSLIAIESTKCRKCKGAHATEFYKRFPHLIEIDTLNHFFTLSDLKAG